MAEPFLNSPKIQDPQVRVISATLTPIICEERRTFFHDKGRDPTQEEMQSIRRRVFDEYVQTARAFQYWADGLGRLP